MTYSEDILKLNPDLAKGISETAFGLQVESLLKLFGWRWTHFRPAWTKKGYRTPLSGDKGLPDYIAVRLPRLLFAELKDQYSKPTPEQEAWLEDLRECVKHIMINPVPVPVGRKIELFPSLEVYLWRPNQIDKIEVILR